MKKLFKNIANTAKTTAASYKPSTAGLSAATPARATSIPPSRC